MPVNNYRQPWCGALCTWWVAHRGSAGRVAGIAWRGRCKRIRGTAVRRQWPGIRTRPIRGRGKTWYNSGTHSDPHCRKQRQCTQHTGTSRITSEPASSAHETRTHTSRSRSHRRRRVRLIVGVPATLIYVGMVAEHLAMPVQRSTQRMQPPNTKNVSSNAPPR